jgi:nucleotide-binding universal stress UspA family protein
MILVFVGSNACGKIRLNRPGPSDRATRGDLEASTTQTARLVRSVLHPTDLSAESDSAFAHALAIALLRETRFTVVHAGVNPDSRRTRNRLPSVRDYLERWGRLQPDSPRSAVFDELSLRVKKVVLGRGDPLQAILDYLDSHPADLIVLATRGREGLPRWIKPSLSEPLARQSRALTLFVPRGARGIVSTEDGRLSLRRILVPVNHRPDPRTALRVATRAVRAMGNGPVELTLLHVGDSSEMPAVTLPDDPAWTWKRERVGGSIVEGILRAAEEHEADLLLMATAGREGILDALRGSTTEQVLRRSPLPLLAVPVDWEGPDDH